jgi:hypothetical protein
VNGRRAGYIPRPSPIAGGLTSPGELDSPGLVPMPPVALYVTGLDCRVQEHPSRIYSE